LKVLVRPVYVSTTLTRRGGVTMTYLRFKRWVWVVLGPGAPEHERRALYRTHRAICALENELQRRWRLGLYPP
jgi:hypothetical protein